MTRWGIGLGSNWNGSSPVAEIVQDAAWLEEAIGIVEPGRGSLDVRGGGSLGWFESLRPEEQPSAGFVFVDGSESAIDQARTAAAGF